MKRQGFFRLILLGIFVCVPLIFAPVIVEQYEFPKLAVMWAGVAVLLGIISWRIPKNDKIALGLIIFAISTLVSAFFSLNLRFSLFGNPVSPNGVVTTFGYLGLYLATRTLLSSGKLGWKFLLWNTVPATISATYALMQYFGHDFIVWQGQLGEYGVIRPGGTVGQPNFLGGYLAMSFFVVLATRESLTKWLRWSLLALFVAAIYVTQSRGAWLSLFVGWLVWLWFVEQVRFHRLLGLVGLLGLVVDVAGRVSGKLNPTHWPTLWGALSRAGAMFDCRGSRAGYFEGALRVWRRYPWFGSGTDTFQLAFEHQRTAHFWRIAPGEAPHRAHNEILNVLATQGVFGVLALGLLVWFVFCATTRLRRGSGYHGVLLAILAAVAVQGLSSIVVVTMGVLAVVSLALLANEVSPALEVTTSKIKTATTALFTALVLMMISIRFIGSFYEKLALQLQHKAPLIALVQAENAVVFQRGDEEFAILVMQIAEQLYDQTHDVGYVRLAMRSAFHAVRLDPEQGFNHFVLGLVLRQVGQQALASLEFDKAVALEPNNPVYSRRGL